MGYFRVQKRRLFRILLPLDMRKTEEFLDDIISDLLNLNPNHLSEDELEDFRYHINEAIMDIESAQSIVSK